MSTQLKKSTFSIRKDDAKYLSKCQVKKAQFLFENDYFIWNEAELYLRFHDIFTTLNTDTDVLYENVCKATRIVFNLIHDVHFANKGSNAAHLKFYEVLDAWGALSEYLKHHNRFPQPFMDWFDSIFQIYQVKNEVGERVIPFENILRLFLFSGKEKKDAVLAYNQLTSDRKFKLTLDRILGLMKFLVASNDRDHFSYNLVPNLQPTLHVDTTEKPPDEVLRNYDYETNNVYSNLSDWKTLDLNTLNKNPKIPLKSINPELKDYYNFFHRQSVLNNSDEEMIKKQSDKQQLQITPKIDTSLLPKVYQIKPNVNQQQQSKPQTNTITVPQKPANNQTLRKSTYPNLNQNLPQPPPPPLITKKPIEQQQPQQPLQRAIIGPMPSPTFNFVNKNATPQIINQKKDAIVTSMPPTQQQQLQQQKSTAKYVPISTTTVRTQADIKINDDEFIRANLNQNALIGPLPLPKPTNTAQPQTKPAIQPKPQIIQQQKLVIQTTQPVQQIIQKLMQNSKETQPHLQSQLKPQTQPQPQSQPQSQQYPKLPLIIIQQTSHQKPPIQPNNHNDPKSSVDGAASTTINKAKYHTINPYTTSAKTTMIVAASISASIENINRPSKKQVESSSQQQQQQQKTQMQHTPLASKTVPQPSARLSTSVNELNTAATTSMQQSNKESPRKQQKSSVEINASGSEEVASLVDSKIITEFKKEFKRSNNDVSFGAGLSKSINTLDLIAKSAFFGSSDNEKSNSYSHSDLRTTTNEATTTTVTSSSESYGRHKQKQSTAQSMPKLPTTGEGASSGMAVKKKKRSSSRPASHFFAPHTSSGDLDSPDSLDGNENANSSRDEHEEEEEDDRYYQGYTNNEEEEEEEDEDAFEKYKIENYSNSNSSNFYNNSGDSKKQNSRHNTPENDDTYDDIGGSNLFAKPSVPVIAAAVGNSQSHSTETSTPNNSNLTSVSKNESAPRPTAQFAGVSQRQSPAALQSSMEKIIKEGILLFSDSSVSGSSSSASEQTASGESKNNNNVDFNESSDQGGTADHMNSSMSTVISTQELSTNPDEFMRKHNAKAARFNRNQQQANGTGADGPVVSRRDDLTDNTTTHPNTNSSRAPPSNNKTSTDSAAVQPPPRNIKQLKMRASSQRSATLAAASANPSTQLSNSAPYTTPSSTTSGTGTNPNVPTSYTTTSNGNNVNARNANVDNDEEDNTSRVNYTTNNSTAATSNAKRNHRFIKNNSKNNIGNNNNSENLELNLNNSHSEVKPAKADKFLKLKTVESKNTFSYGAGGVGVTTTTEPFKSIVNAITLSSLDTLNDIDSEDEGADEDVETENIFAMHNQILENSNIEHDNELLMENNIGHRIINQKEDDEDKDEVRRGEEDGGENYDDYNEESEFIKHLHKANTDESADQFNTMDDYNRYNSYYNYNIHGINNNVNMNPVTNISGTSVAAAAHYGADNKYMFEQDWSYSQNSNVFNFSISDQKLVGEIIRKLKPYIYKSIRKEVKLYFERNLTSMHQY